MWEGRPEDWPDDEPWEVDVDKHDFTERQWLAPAHRAALDAGELDVPERTQSEHSAVLVSVPAHHEGTPVAWVDRGVAEIAHHLARLGAPTAESCENAGGKEGHYGWPPDAAMLWFDDQDELTRFAEVAEHLQGRQDWGWFQPRETPLQVVARLADYVLPGVVPYPERSKPGEVHAVSIPVDDLPRVAAALREIPTPSPYGPLPTDKED